MNLDLKVFHEWRTDAPESFPTCANLNCRKIFKLREKYGVLRNHVICASCVEQNNIKVREPVVNAYGDRRVSRM
jgi:hypothetical protein